jgi:cold shock CspA family protein
VEYKGQLVRWNDDRGFGFIKVLAGGEDVFIHITALKDMPRRPVVGDIIYFQEEQGEDGKTRAKSARIEGLAKTPRKTGTQKNDNGYVYLYVFAFVFVFVFLVIILVAILSYQKFSSPIIEKEDFTRSILRTVFSKNSNRTLNLGTCHRSNSAVGSERDKIRVRFYQTWVKF